MRKIVILGGVLFLAACGGNPDVAPKVTYGYGAGNGDPVPFNGPAPVYSFGNGLGADMPVAAGQMPTITRAYGADETKNVTEQMSPTTQPQQNFAAPAPTNPHPAIAPATSSHL